MSNQPETSKPTSEATLAPRACSAQQPTEQPAMYPGLPSEADPNVTDSDLRDALLRHCKGSHDQCLEAGINVAPNVRISGGAKENKL